MRAFVAVAVGIGLVLAGCAAAGTSRPQRPKASEPPPAPPAPQRGNPKPPASPAAAVPAPGPPPAATRARTAPRPIDIPAIDRLAQQAIAEGKMPGCVVVVGRRDGIVFRRAYGRRAIKPRSRPMREDTIFDLASLTKPIVTASLVQILVERGQLSLDTPVASYLPEFASHGKQTVTLRQLLVHSSGLPRVNPLSEYDGDAASAMHAILETRPIARPGTRYLYSDLGYITLGAVIERVAGQTLDVVARRELFEPLGMHDSYFRPEPGLRDRIAPTEETDKRPVPLIHGEVHDPRSYRLGGVAGNAGLFSTAADLSRYARMLLGEGELEGRRVLSRASVQDMTRAHFVDGTVRTPGWDMDSDYSKPRGHFMSGRAFGHGGYTGTSLWVDPEQDAFVLFLSNRVHPDGKGNVIALEGAIADAAMRALSPTPAVCRAATPAVDTGIDALRARGFEPLVGKRVGLVTHDAAVAADGTPTLDVLANAPGVTLSALFSPEHGLSGSAEGVVADARDRQTGLRVHSLFGRTRRPSSEMLRDVDILVVDLVDVGTRFYTYMSTLQQVMLAGAEQGIPVVVLDRPNPIGGVRVEGPLLDPGVRSFVNYHRLPVRHGMTAGELAELIAAEDRIGVRLEIVEAPGWERSLYAAQTGLPWRNPSPNLRSPEAALLYPAIGLLESTNLSVGRGTEAPFSVVGAPFVDASRLLERLDAARLPALTLSTATFVPRAAPYQSETCQGLRLTVTDPATFAPVRTALTIAREMFQLYRDQWQADKLMRLWGSRRVVQGIMRGAAPTRIERSWQPELDQFMARRARFLRYPDCSGKRANAEATASATLRGPRARAALGTVADEGAAGSHP